MIKHHFHAHLIVKVGVTAALPSQINSNEIPSTVVWKGLEFFIEVCFKGGVF